MSVVKPAIQFPVLIAHLEGANNYTWLHFRDGEKRLLSKSLSYLEAEPELIDFIRVHKTVLINPICVERLLEPPRAKMAGAVQLEGGVVLPVSRRRWSQVASLLQSKLVPAPALRSGLNAIAPVPPASTEAASPRSVVVVTSDSLSALLLSEIARENWPNSALQIQNEAVPLSDQLSHLPNSALPALIVLDARTLRQERLNALKLLKESNELSWIPVVLLLSPTDEAVYDGYHRRANSVITVGREHTQFVQTIKRVGQFWLETAALPGLADVPA